MLVPVLLSTQDMQLARLENTATNEADLTAGLQEPHDLAGKRHYTSASGVLYHKTEQRQVQQELARVTQKSGLTGQVGLPGETSKLGLKGQTGLRLRARKAEETVPLMERHGSRLYSLRREVPVLAVQAHDRHSANSVRLKE